MTTGSDRQAEDSTQRRVGNLYKRLEEARAQRAKILATPKPANKPTPVDGKKIVPTRVFPEKKSPGRERLPRLKPAAFEPIPEPTPEIEATAPPRRRSAFLGWHAAIVVVLLTAAFALSTKPEAVTVSTEAAASMTAPEVRGETPALPAAVSAPDPQSVSGLASTALDPVPVRPIIGIAPSPEVQFEAPIAMPAISAERPRQNPRSDTVVERSLPPELRITSIEADNFNAPGDTATTLNLRPAVNLPRAISDSAAQDVAAKLDALGLAWGSPRYFDFNVNQTQVRYFHSADMADAEKLAEAFGATLRDFTGFQPLPPEGRVELWVAGRSTAQPQSAEETNILGDVRRDLRQLGTNLQGALRTITRYR